MRNITATAIFLLASIAILAACSDPRDVQIAKLTKEQTAEMEKKLNGEEERLLMGYMMRQGMGQAFGGKGMPEGVTVRQAINEQRAWVDQQKQEEAKADELKKKVEAERQAKQEEFAKLLSVALVSKKNVDGEYGQKYVSLEMAFENKTNKDIRGVKGVLKLNDIFGDLIEGVSFSYDQGVPAGKTSIYKGGVDINQFMDKDKKLWSTDFDKLKAVFETSMIIFKDGTQVAAPQ